MTDVLKFSNNSNTTLASSINNTATSLAVAAGTGSLFPPLSAGQAFKITLTDVATRTDIEIMNVTARSGDVFTVERGQEGTVAQNWTAGDIVNGRVTAGMLGSFQQTVNAQAQTENYAADTGIANAYACTLSPSISSPLSSMPIRVLIAHTNTGASTFNPGSGVADVVDQRGLALRGGELVAGCIAEFFWNGTGWQWMGAVAVGTPGVVDDYCGAAPAPSGALLCFGQAVSRTAYPRLNKICSDAGYPYGSGDGTTTFNVPDVRGRVIAGLDNMGGSAAGRLTNTTMTPNGTTLGAVPTSETQTKTAATSSTGSTSGSLSYSGSTDSNNFAGNAGGGGTDFAASPHQHTYNGTTTGSLTVAATGTSSAFSIVQPTILMNKIVWY